MESYVSNDRTVFIDRTRDEKLSDFSKATLNDRYLLPGESYQDLFARVACAYSDDSAHAQRIYDYMSNLWFLGATPVLSNGGASRGLPISCLTGETLVTTIEGQKRIDEISAGDRVLTHRGRFRTVVAVASRESEEIYRLTTNGHTISITGNHPVKTPRGWVRIDGLRLYEDVEKDTIALVEERLGIVGYSQIDSLVREDGSYTVYDIQVADDESFVVHGLALHNCFLNEATDSLNGIVDLWNENVWLASNGGGIGSYWGNLRSIGEGVSKAGKTSGIIPFIKVMDSMTLAISQGSLRRGSAAVYLDVSHPEIEEFLEIRKPTGGDPNRKALNLNHAVMIPDSFMRALEIDGDWDLVSPKNKKVMKTVKARDLWHKMLTLRIETGEPYIVFSDRANEMMPEHHKKSGLSVKTSNLCSEILLPTGIDHHGKNRTAVCCLSSLNLEKYDEWEGVDGFVEDVLRFLDNVLQDFIDRAPDGMESAKYSASRERSVGLGVMGFHSFLQKRMIPIEGVMAKVWNKRIFEKFKKDCDEANEKLALEKGPCPDAAEHGVMKRFSNCSAIAPTASISIIASNSSPGIEPYAANAFTHKTLTGSFPIRNKYLISLLEEKGMNTQDVWSGIVTNMGSVQHLDFLTDHEKDVFKTAFEIDQRWLVDLAADRTPYVDQSQSFNLFLPADVDKKYLNFIHYLAWKAGVKSLYYCRSRSLKRADVVSRKVVREEIEVDETQFEDCLSCQ